MAKKKKAHHHRRRRRVGAIGMSGALMKLAGVTAGAAAGAFVVSGIRKNFATLPKAVAPAATAAIGVMLPRFVKNPMAEAFGLGMAAVSAAQLLSSTVIALPGISGPGTYRAIPRIQRSVGAPGFVNNPINGTMDPAVIGALWDA